MLAMVMEAYVPALFEALGLFIPLIVVNCIVLARAESFASKNNPLLSLFDGLFMGLGFTLALTLLGLLREILGSGSAFGYKFIEGDAMLLFVLAPGGFIGLGLLSALVNYFRNK